MRKSWFSKLMLAVSVAGVFAAAPASAATSLKMAYALSTNSHYGAGAQAFGKSIEAATGGEFTLEHFPNSALGGEREVIEGLQLGTIDLAIVSTGATLNFVPSTGCSIFPSCSAIWRTRAKCWMVKSARKCSTLFPSAA